MPGTGNMSALTDRERCDLLSAIGWLELGNASEALAELGQLPAESRVQPDVLEVEWSILARLARWQEAVEVAETLVTATPKRASGWLDRSYALHELKRTAEAMLLLLPAAKRFPKHCTIPYNLACYACVLGDHESASKWLTKAMSLGGAEKIKLQALEDPDLAAMRDEIRRL